MKNQPKKVWGDWRDYVAVVTPSSVNRSPVMMMLREQAEYAARREAARQQYEEQQADSSPGDLDKGEEPGP